MRCLAEEQQSPGSSSLGGQSAGWQWQRGLPGVVFVGKKWILEANCGSVNCIKIECLQKGTPREMMSAREQGVTTPQIRAECSWCPGSPCCPSPCPDSGPCAWFACSGILYNEVVFTLSSTASRTQPASLGLIHPRACSDRPFMLQWRIFRCLNMPQSVGWLVGWFSCGWTLIRVVSHLAPTCQTLLEPSMRVSRCTGTAVLCPVCTREWGAGLWVDRRDCRAAFGSSRATGRPSSFGCLHGAPRRGLVFCFPGD